MEKRDWFANDPRVPLLFAPTPLHKAEKLSAELGIELWLKRDDLTGPSAFGGNKMRKLEFLMGQALAEGAEYVFTFGATQSNHVMQTAAACCRCGLKAVLYLVAVVPPDAESLRANMLLDALFGAEVHVVTMLPGEDEAAADARALELARAQMAKLRAEGHGCLEVPIGGASIAGSLGFASGYLEMRGQQEALGLAPFESLYHATGSAGTLAGLLAGRAICGSGEAMRPVCVGVGDTAAYTRWALELANQVLAHLEAEQRVAAGDMEVQMDYIGPGYEIPSEASTGALKRLARTEGIVLDPVYTAKAFAALLDHVATGRIRPGERVLFWHTGGTTALFAEPAIVGDLEG